MVGFISLYLGLAGINRQKVNIETGPLSDARIGKGVMLSFVKMHLG